MVRRPSPHRPSSAERQGLAVVRNPVDFEAYGGPPPAQRARQQRVEDVAGEIRREASDPGLHTGNSRTR